MYLYLNGKVVSNSATLETLKTHVSRWNSPTSGWDTRGNFWKLSEHFRQERHPDNRILPDERANDGSCGPCGRRHIHKDDCPTLKRRRTN